jgi:hypothetical protein
MSRRGVEAKPPWDKVPRPVRVEAERVLGARIARASRIYGGVAASATFRLTLADGRRAFFKGIWQASNDFMHRALVQEERVYRELTDAISPWAPAFLGSIRVDDWHALLLEDLGPADVPPWTARAVRDAAREFAAFHSKNEGRPFPQWVPAWNELLSAEARLWRGILDESRRLAAVASLAGERMSEAHEWVARHGPRLHAIAECLHEPHPPHALLYLDARADNVRVPPGRLRLFDWNWVAVGPAETDIAAFAEGIAIDGGPVPERFVDEYRRHRPVNDEALDAAVAALAGLFASSASGPPRPDLPRLRSWQRRQFKVCLEWAARRFALPLPGWLAAVPD